MQEISGQPCPAPAPAPRGQETILKRNTGAHGWQAADI